MIMMNKEELSEILVKHELWLKGKDGGWRANLSGANLYCANLSGANLSGANLYCANLSGANLSGANLSGANLYCANLSGANGNMQHIKSIFVDTYAVVYTDEVLQIGCEHHLISEWKDFDDKRILDMNGRGALKFWNKYKALIFQYIELSPAIPTGYVKKGE